MRRRNPESLGGLRPAFDRDGAITAGNASQLSDGAAALVVTSKEWAQEHLTEVERPTRMVGSSPGDLRGAATVRFQIMDWVAEDELTVEYELGARIEEDGGTPESLPISVAAPLGLTVESNGAGGVAVYRGTLRKNHPEYFTVETADYSDEWTVDIYFDAKVIEHREGGRDDGA